HGAGAREMNDAKRFSLGEGRFLEFPFALIGFRLPVWCAGELIMCFERAGGPLAQPIIGTGRRHKLHCEDREQEKHRSLFEHTKHDVLPLKKPCHRTMMSTQSAIPPARSSSAWLEVVDRQ